jgi:hypothetical protein
MGTIYELMTEPGYQYCMPVDERDHGTIVALMNGTPRAASWKPLKMRLRWFDERGRPYKRSDSPSRGTSTAPMFTRRAVEALEPMLQEHGEILPLDCDDAELWIFNPTRVLPAIDMLKSGVSFMPGTRDIERIRRYVFEEDVIAGSDIFKLANMRASPTFVGQRFVDVWRSAGLRGIEFEPARGFP